jgi:hypothetical protein
MATSVTEHSIKANVRKQTNSRLAQKIVENYIDKTKMSFSVLQKVWFDELQGTDGVIKNLNDIDKENEQNYYIDTPITLSDGTKIAICNQWEEKKFSNFILHARQLGVEIKSDDFQVEYVTNYSKKSKSRPSNLL